MKNVGKKPALNYKVIPENIRHVFSGDTKSFGIECYEAPRKYFDCHQVKK